MIQIAICEDNFSYAKGLSFKITKYFMDKDFEMNISIISKPEEFADMDIKKFDLFFLDIELGSINGIDLGVKIKKLNSKADIIYISGFYNYALLGYQARPLAYILKEDEQFDALLEQALNEYIQEKTPFKSTTVLKNKQEVKKIFLKDIVYIKSTGRKLTFFFVDEDPFEIYGKISDTESQLSECGFLRTQKSYIVNTAYIDKITNYKVYLITGEILPISETYYDSIEKDYILRKGFK